MHAIGGGSRKKNFKATAAPLEQSRLHDISPHLPASLTGWEGTEGSACGLWQPPVMLSRETVWSGWLQLASKVGQGESDGGAVPLGVHSSSLPAQGGQEQVQLCHATSGALLLLLLCCSTSAVQATVLLSAGAGSWDHGAQAAGRR